MMAAQVHDQHLPRLRHHDGMNGLNQCAGGTLQTSKRSAVMDINNHHTMVALVAHQQTRLVRSQTQAAQPVKMPEAGPLRTKGKHKLPRDRLNTTIKTRSIMMMK
jgi:hypothetical protein